MAMLCGIINILAQDAFIEGGQFVDRILPMEGHQLSSDTWGAPGVIPRLVDNGIEDRTYTYWGGNIVKDENGLYHLNISGWPENSAKGFNTWSSGSMVYHAVSENVWGPYRNIATIGKGHNAETYRAKDGTWVIYIINGRYTAPSLDGPWEAGSFDFDLRDRAIVGGPETTVSLSNITFAKRQDGSMLALDRNGGVWVSTDGLSAYRHLTDHTVYNGNTRYLEDPVIWRDSLQYHMIVNDWNARHAIYSRSIDGLHWTQEDGTAYSTGVARHSDGSVEDWYKLERPKVYLDESGRAAYLNLAVVDTIKAEDKASDNHSAKNIVLPLNKGLMLEVLNETTITGTTTEIRIRVKAEAGFNPQTDLDLNTLVFGSHSKVNYGNGFKASGSEAEGDDLIITFTGKSGESGITASEFAPKLIGKDKSGKMVYGYARLPYVNYRPAILSARLPKINELNELTEMEVENLGLTASAETDVRIYDSNNRLLAQGNLAPIDPYGSHTLALTTKRTIPAGTEKLTVKFFQNNKEADVNTLSVANIVVAQNELKSLIATAQEALADPTKTNGRNALQDAIDEATAKQDTYILSIVSDATENLRQAITAFEQANGITTYIFDFYNWAMKDNATIQMKSQSVTISDGGTKTVAVADYVSDGVTRQDFEGKIAFNQGSNYFNLRNNGINNASSGLFDFRSDAYFCLLDLQPGDQVTLNITGLDATFVSTNAYKEDDPGQSRVKAGDTVASGQTYVITGSEGRKTRLIIKGVHYTTIKSVKIVSTDKTSTGINTLHSQPKSSDKGFYTLQGIKYEKPQSGIFIHQGRTYLLSAH